LDIILDYISENGLVELILIKLILFWCGFLLILVNDLRA